MSLTYLKGSRTKTKNNLLLVLEKGQAITDDGAKSTQLSMVITTLATAAERFDAALEKLSLAIDEMDDDNARQAEELELEANLSLLGEAEQLLAKLKELQPPATDAMATQAPADTRNDVVLHQLLEQLTNHVVSPPVIPRPSTSVKLPTLTFPTFNGEPLAWTPFWDGFLAAVDGNERFAPVEKFVYLKGKLEGDALAAVAGLPLTNVNYPVAVDILRKRFGDKQRIIDAHYRALMELPAASSSSSLKSVFDNIEKHFRCLEALQQNIEQPVFVSMLTSKLPSAVLYQMELQRTDQSWTTTSLRASLEHIIQATEAAERNKATPGSTFAQASPFPSSCSIEAGESVLLAPGKPAQTPTGPSSPCLFCKGQHWMSDCPRFPTSATRKAALHGRCYTCLSTTHSTHHCRRQRACRHCRSKQHHSVLCPKQYPEPVTCGTSATTTSHHNTNVEPAAVAEQADHELGAPDTPTPESCLLAPHETVVMQTARTDLENPVTRDAFTAHILFDTGSQRSYITQAIANRLSLKCVGTDTLSIATFGATQPTPIQSPRVHVGLTQRDGSVLTITANVIPTITGPVHRAVLPNLERVCQHLCLADNLPKHGEVTNIDLLIGNDYYHDIISADRLSVGPSLHLLSSTLGWIVSGRAPPTTDANSSLSTVSMTSVLSTNTNGSQLATAKPRTSLVAGKPIHPPLALETPNINDHPTISDNDNIALADIQRSVQHTSGPDQDQTIITQKARPYPHASNCSSTTGCLCHLINRPPRYTTNATTQLLPTRDRTHHISSPKFGWCFSLSPCSTSPWIHHMPAYYTSVPPGSRNLHTCAARTSSCRQPDESTSAISPSERCCLRKNAAGI